MRREVRTPREWQPPDYSAAWLVGAVPSVLINGWFTTLIALVLFVPFLLLALGWMQRRRR